MTLSGHEEFRRVLESVSQADTTDTGAALSWDKDIAADRHRSGNVRSPQALDRLTELSTSRSYIPADALARMYGDEGTPTSPKLGARRPDCEMVAEELGLTSHLTRADLGRIRREFALANHPDRVAPWRRDLATHRMTVANMLIDQAVRSKKNRTS